MDTASTNSAGAGGWSAAEHGAASHGVRDGGVTKVLLGQRVIPPTMRHSQLSPEATQQAIGASPLAPADDGGARTGTSAHARNRAGKSRRTETYTPGILVHAAKGLRHRS